MAAKIWMSWAVAVALTLIQSGVAEAQSRGFSNRDRLFMVYNSIQNQRNQRQLSQQQQMLQGQFNQMARQQSMLANRGWGGPDPIEQYVRESQGQAPGRAFVPPIYSGAYRSHFGGHMRYFNPQ
jgi:hypothetical protein